MPDPDPLRGLTVDRLANYLDNKRQHQTEADRDMIAATLAAAVGFAEIYCQTTFADPVAAELADAIYTAAARQWRERDAAFSEVAMRAMGDGPDVTYFRGLPQRVKMVYDLHRAPFAVEFSVSWAWLDRLVEIEESVAESSEFPEMRAYRWAPTSQVQPPAIFNRLAPSRTELIDCFARDVLNVEVVVVARHTESRVDMAQLEDYMDALRVPLDAEIYAGRRLGLRTARRVGIFPFQERFNDIIYPGLAYRLELHVEHRVL